MRRHIIELHDQGGRAVPVNVDMRMDVIEVHCPGYPLSSTPLVYFAQWLADPSQYEALTFDDCTWRATTGPVALTLGTLTGDLPSDVLDSMRSELVDAR